MFKSLMAYQTKQCALCMDSYADDDVVVCLAKKKRKTATTKKRQFDGET